MEYSDPSVAPAVLDQDDDGGTSASSAVNAPAEIAERRR
jgi:hypothetical protein